MGLGENFKDFIVCCHLKDCKYNDGLGCCTLEGVQASQCTVQGRNRYTRVLHPKEQNPKTKVSFLPKRERR